MNTSRSPILSASSTNRVDRSWPAKRTRVVVLILIVLSTVGMGRWWMVTLPRRELRSSAALVAAAYSQQRAFEFRLPASSYAPARPQQDKKGPELFGPTPLLEAEGRIVEHLAKDPDNAEWLRLKARADMLEADS